MQDELTEFERNDVWTLLPTPPNTSIVGSRWVYRNKSDEDRVIILNKAQLIVKGYSQQEGIDYDETFAPSICRTQELQSLPNGSPRAWYGTLTKFLLESNFKRGTIDPTLFRKVHDNHLIVVQIYVDDIIFGSTSLDLSKAFSEIMKSRFTMSMMGELNFFLGLQIKKSTTGIFISQEEYIKTLLKKYSIENSSSVKTPMSTSYKLDSGPDCKIVDQKKYRGMIGSLLYLTSSRPDIMFPTCLCARYQANPKELHEMAVKRIFKYLRVSPSLGLWYPSHGNYKLQAFIDSDYGGCQLDRKSTSGSCQFLGGCLVSWTSKKQFCVSTSTAEAEYVAASSCCSQVLWMQTQLKDYGYKMQQIPIYCDSKSAIAISHNPVNHSMTKHIDIRYHFLKDNIQKGHIELLTIAISSTRCSIQSSAFANQELKEPAQLSFLFMGTKWDGVLNNCAIADMDAIGKEAQLRGFEFARSITLVAEPFTMENGLLTPTFKLHFVPTDEQIVDVLSKALDESKFLHFLGRLGMFNPESLSPTSSYDEVLGQLFPNDYFPRQEEEEILIPEEETIPLTKWTRKFERKDVWTLLPTPTNTSIVGSRWFYRNKSYEDGVIIRNKARLIVKGYSQQEGIEYDETFAPSICRTQELQNPKFPNHCFKLKKAVYGLKQAPRAWYGTFTKFLLESNFKRGTIDPTLFRKVHDNHLIVVQIYVDDIIFGSTSLDLSKAFAELMKSRFRMSMMGELNFFLGLQVKQSSTDIKKTPRNCTKWPLKKIFKYLRGSTSLGLWYPSHGNCKLQAFIDSDYGGCRLDRKSTLGSFQFLGGYLVSCTSKKQSCVSTSTAEAEYVAASSCCSQVLWMQTQLKDNGYKMQQIPIDCDSKSAIAISHNPVNYSMTKHIHIRYHFLKDNIQKGHIELHFAPTNEQIADVLSKALAESKFLYFVGRLGMFNPESLSVLSSKLFLSSKH
ncbi:hypothetical protein LXL04_020366 [Taraxacum kok-saghyz]